ncbi:Na(+)/H(+) antiporter subunit [Halomicronema hongdechloris C2206]|uniref:Na(+)/H(+) antiporter subunit n=1 Tax=Halomicronema hongdechloris C2206 TaxID=1641165 RepID=A0A1V8NFL2_9CYAN|nr:Na+/H+ antiporter subunit E [Halomicronema hongdechloris]ASC69889.1 Na(+)/H(+) antiporter subunit [Halomicronema hongdechloris C2206]
MIRCLDLILRLTIWLLLTSDISLANIGIGTGVALLLPRHPVPTPVLRDWLHIIGRILVAIPKAYIEAIEMVIFPHTREEFTQERVRPNRSPGLVFLDILLITFTPKTIAVNYHQEGWYEVHRLRRR